MSHPNTDVQTFFILDLMRQKREDVMRWKKDHLINEMADKMREDRKKSKSQDRVVNYGGFVGVNNLTSSKNDESVHKFVPRKHSRRSREEQQQEPPHPHIDTSEGNDILIMGMIRDEREKRFHEKHQVYDEMAAVPSENRYREKYDS